MPEYIDVFNGDADGICALHQLRLEEPRSARLVTGVKRDVCLLAQLKDVRDADITVLDVSLDVNRAPLLRILESCRVLYVDHHASGEIPETPALVAQIDTAAETCTSLIVDRMLGGRYRAWAVAAAFGDNLHDAARRTAALLALSEDELARLREIGELLNYNGYGKSVEDLHFHPAYLYEAVKPFADPFDFWESSDVLATLRDGFQQDMNQARGEGAYAENDAGRIYKFPSESWARRAAGVFMNEKARESPGQAHALLVENGDGTIMVSLRAPLDDRRDADTVCRSFPTGGGRAAAAGINALPGDMLDHFLLAFSRVYS